MSIRPDRPQPSVSSVLSVRDPSPLSRAVIELEWSDLFKPSNHLGCPSVAPEGETAERVVRESACRGGIERDVDDSRRSLTSKADVRRSAVSVGFAAGRLTGTRGTLKARVDHSIVASTTTSRIHVDHSRRGFEDDIVDPRRSRPSGRE
jgi:hypothetical protein